MSYVQSQGSNMAAAEVSMSTTNATATTDVASQPATQVNGAPESNGDRDGKEADLAAEGLAEKYKEEMRKRLRDDGMKQWIDGGTDQKLAKLLEDPWANSCRPHLGRAIENDSYSKFLIVGAGFSALLTTYYLRQAGFSSDGITIVDEAAGWGGTWYWNRYPGIMCDSESYMYLPLLEQTGYMPTEKYVGGDEIRRYIEFATEKFGFRDRASFRLLVKSTTWDEEAKEWTTEMTRLTSNDQNNERLKIRSRYVFMLTGVLNRPKFTKVPGMEAFEGEQLHTSRWNYDLSGGSSSDPQLDKLQTKRIAYIGTGCTGIQAVPQIAKWAKQLFVVQRTPSPVHPRNNKATDPVEWAKVTKEKGWQKKRFDNFQAFLNGHEPAPDNITEDGFTRIPSLVASFGRKGNQVDYTSKGDIQASVQSWIQDWTKHMHDIDRPIQQGVRDRTDEIVKDKATANALKPWYPSWCKRCTFHDEYLQSFNQPNVKLVDTNGKGIEKITRTGIVVQGKEYEVDLIVWSTGFNAESSLSLQKKSGLDIIGRDSKTIDEHWADYPKNLHGNIGYGTPNMFWFGPLQTAVSTNFTVILEIMAQHSVYMITETEKRAGGNSVAIEPTLAGVDGWTQQLAAGAPMFAAAVGCTPGYFNGEGSFAVDKIAPEQLANRARMASWGTGVQAFEEHIEAWRKNGEMEGIEVRTG